MRRGKKKNITLPHFTDHSIRRATPAPGTFYLHSLDLLRALIDGLSELPGVRVERVEDYDHFCSSWFVVCLIKRRIAVTLKIFFLVWLLKKESSCNSSTGPGYNIYI